MGMIGHCLAISEAQLDQLIADPSKIINVILPNGETPANDCDLDKAWHAIHYLLNDDAWYGEGILGLTILGGMPIGEDLVYGPVRYLTPEEVQEVNEELADFDTSEMRSSYDAEELDANEIYPTIWVRDGNVGLEYVISYYERLQEYYRAAAERGNAMLTYVI